MMNVSLVLLQTEYHNRNATFLLYLYLSMSKTYNYLGISTLSAKSVSNNPETVCFRQKQNRA